MTGRTALSWLGALGSRRAIGGLALPLGLSVLSLTAGEGRAVPLDGVAARIWAGALALALTVAAVRAVADRRGARALACAAALFALAQAALLAGNRFDGTIELGEGEQATAWRTARTTLWGLPPRVELVELSGDGEPVARVRVDGREVTARIGSEIRVSDTSLRVGEPLPVVGAEVSSRTGRDVDAVLVKLTPGVRTYFQVGLLPHRFYVTSLGRPDERGRPERLHVRVQRGKVNVLERDLRVGEQLSFEGLILSFVDATRWARIDARRAPRPWLLLPAAVLAAASAGWSFAVQLLRGWTANRGR
ncbi:MAG: hypothetical protein WCC48_05590 [Anaeromyxobacteraceae bacterium]